MTSAPLDLRAALEELAASTATGVLTAAIVLEGDLDRLDAAVERGDVRAAQFVAAMLTTVDQVRRAPPDGPARCAGCNRPVRLSELGGCGVVFPAMPRNAGDQVTMILCRSCGATRAGALAAVRAAMTRGASEVEIMNIPSGAGGRA